MKPILICPTYSVFMQVCHMYGFDPREMDFVDHPKGLMGVGPIDRVFIYVAAGMPRGVHECVEYLNYRGVGITHLQERHPTTSTMVQYQCFACGQTIQTFANAGPVWCSHPGTSYEGVPPQMLMGDYRYNRDMSSDPWAISSDAWVIDGTATIPGPYCRMGVDYSSKMPYPPSKESGPCKKCSEGILLMDHIKTSKDNYCTCEEGKKLRKKSKVALK